MYSLTRCFNLILTIFAISACTDSIKTDGNQNQDMQVVQTFQWANTFPWEHMLRESVFRTISPSPLANNPLYRRILGALFYPGPLPITPEHDTSTLVLSRGYVYYLPDGRWILCQEGCVDCEACNLQTHPLLKWILRRIKRITYGSPRYDVQLTIVPQARGNYHMANLWPRSYVYVASQGEVLRHSADTFPYADAASAFTDLENNSSVRHGMTNRFSSLAGRHPAAEAGIDKSNISIGPQDVLTVPREDSTTASVSRNPMPLENEQDSENKQRARHFPKTRPTTRATEPPAHSNDTSTTPVVPEVETKDSLPQLILGTDQLGQKHLVHVVATDGKSNYPKDDFLNSWPAVEPTKLLYNSSKPDYQQVLQKIFHSLVTHRRSIERFLQSPAGKITSKTQSAMTAEDAAKKDGQEVGHRVNAVNPGIGFYPGYNEVNKSHSSVGTVPPVVLDALRERRQSTSPLNTTEISSSSTSESQGVDGCFKLSAVTRNDTVSASNHRAERSIAESSERKVPTVVEAMP